MIRSHSNDSIRVLTLDRPEHRNALTPEGLDALRNEFRSATEPVVYLHGAGEAFCAGADLETVESLDRESAIEFARRGQAVANTIEEYDGAVVAGIDGAARGGGVEVALACDVRIATPDATLAESGVSLGLFGAWGGTVRLPRIVGEGPALDIALSGRVLDAREAREIGLISRIDSNPRSIAEEFANNDPNALVTIKRRIRDTGPKERRETREASAFGDLIEKFGDS